jgi:hypothetical protein
MNSTAVLIKGIKELNNTVQSLHKRIEMLEKKNISIYYIMPQKKKEKKTNKKTHRKKHLTHKKIFYFNQFQLIVQTNLQDIKIIKIILNMDKQHNKNQEQIIY